MYIKQALFSRLKLRSIFGKERGCAHAPAIRKPKQRMQSFSENKQQQLTRYRSLTVTYPSGTIFFCDIAHRVISLALTNVGEKGQRAHPLCDEDRVGLFSSAHHIEAKRKSFSHVESLWGAGL